MAKRHRSTRTSLRAIISDGGPLFLASFPRTRGPGAGVPKKLNIDPSLSAIWGQKVGPVNWRGVARDVPGSWRWGITDNRHCARRPSPRSLLEAEGALFLAPLPRRRGPPGRRKNGGGSGKKVLKDEFTMSFRIRYSRFRTCARNSRTLPYRGCGGAILAGLSLCGFRKRYI